MSKAKLAVPCALSIAGLDPSGGAGLLADIKTFERNAVLGLGVCTGFTFQTDEKFLGLKWLAKKEILQQLDPLIERFPFTCVKVGLIENLVVLRSVLEHLQKKIPQVQVVWDPVARASADFTFHESFDRDELRAVLKQVTLVTPNYKEQILLEEAGGEDFLRVCGCALLCKSQRQDESSIIDVLRTGSDEFQFAGKLMTNAEKHGSGCVLSAAICAALAKGQQLFNACATGRRYSEQYLASSDSLIGIHPAYV